MSLNCVSPPDLVTLELTINAVIRLTLLKHIRSCYFLLRTLKMSPPTEQNSHAALLALGSAPLSIPNCVIFHLAIPDTGDSVYNRDTAYNPDTFKTSLLLLPMVTLISPPFSALISVGQVLMAEKVLAPQGDTWFSSALSR